MTVAAFSGTCSLRRVLPMSDSILSQIAASEGCIMIAVRVFKAIVFQFDNDENVEGYLADQ